MTNQTNLGVKPLGRQGYISPTAQKEINALKNYGAALRTAGPSNSEEKGKLHRQAYIAYLKELGNEITLAKIIKTYNFLKLAF